MSPAETKIIYMGTPEFAIAPLKALLSEGFDVVAVVTTPDKPAGRGKKMQSPAVKTFALQEGLIVLQPEKLKDPEFLIKLHEFKPDLMVVVAFRMLPQQVWSLPRLGTFNLHASLLPQYRGAAPINHAIINGEKETGVTTFFIDEKIDTGKILFREKVTITEHFSAGDLHDKLMETGASLVVKTVKVLVSGKWKEIPQEELIGPKETLHPAPKIFKEDCHINWDWDGRRIYNFIRGLSPSPTATAILTGKAGDEIPVKIFSSSFIPTKQAHPNGSIVLPDKKTLYVSVVDGYISITSIQMAGKNRVDALSFLNGFQGISNYCFRCNYSP